MSEQKSDKNKGEKKFEDDNPLKVKCPFCGENTTLILDPKQISDKKTTHICLICGQTFEYIKQQEK